MDILRKLFFHSPIHYITALVIGTALTLLRLISTDFSLLIHYIDALTIAGAIVFLLGMLGVVSRLGAFDTFAYSFSTFRRQSKYRDLYDYKEKKNEKASRKELTFMPYITVGAVFLAVGFSLYIFMP